jgi:hypothetical protein
MTAVTVPAETVPARGLRRQLGQVMIHALTHTTTDTATGEATASVDRFLFTCH